MSFSTVTLTIRPDVDGFIKALRRLGRAAQQATRDLKAQQRRQAILNKQATRDAYRANRRPALIHNGGKP